MALTQHHLQTRLIRFEFDTLFCQDLGWVKASADKASRLVGHQPSRLECRLVATPGQPQGVVMVQGSLPESQTPDRFHRWLDQFTQLYPDPLVIWVEPQGQRSLWCWLGDDAHAPFWRTRCLVNGQGDRQWARSLVGLQVMGNSSLGRQLNRFSTLSVVDLLPGFRHAWQTLTQALKAIPQETERQHYSMVLLCRLLAAAVLQHRGYLGGDEWYLHNQFGQSQQRGRDRFFSTVFQPLCHQGFTLPPAERPLPLQQQLGSLPFLPNGPFVPHALDGRWGQVPLADAAFEPALTWLGDWLMAAARNPLDLMLGLGERLVNDHCGAGLATPEPILSALCDRTLTTTLLDRATGLTGQPQPALDPLLMTITAPQASKLLAELGQLTVLDPACGSGRFLVAALQHLAGLAQTLRGIAGQGDPGLVPPWAQGGTRGGTGAQTSDLAATLAIYRHLLTHSVYGVDLWPPAVELARLQLFLQAVDQTTCPEDLVGLPDLTLTILPGNGLIGLVEVEAERFDQVQPRGRRATAASTNGEPPLQGNLLQPLLADTYQAVLAERQVRLEHYRSQTQLLAEAGSVPVYAQADFLRDRIQELNHIAQGKLTHLLWSECSQQIGMRVQYQNASGHRQSRPLDLTDVEALNPFHWGFYFHHMLQERGGFDVIISHLPTGAVQPSEDEFIARHQDLFQQKNIAPSTFLRNRPQVLTIDNDLAQAWCEYRSSFSFPNQYFRRTSTYPYASQLPPNRSQGRLYWSRLYLERSVQLLRPHGRCGLVLEPFWDQANSAPLRHWLQANVQLDLVIDVANYGQLWPELPARTTLSLLWLKRAGQTSSCPYVAYNRAPKALSPGALGVLLQRLVDLAE